MFCLNSCAIAMIVTQVHESFPWLFSWPFSHIMLLIVSKILQDFLFEQEMFTLTTTFASYVSQNRFMKKEDREIKNSEGLRPQDIFKCQNSIEQTTGEGGQKGTWWSLDEGHGRLTVKRQDQNLTLWANLELPILKMKIIRTLPTFVRMYYMNDYYWDGLGTILLFIVCMFPACLEERFLVWNVLLSLY